jgi:hypothetical protein
VISFAGVRMSGMRRSRLWFDKTLSSASDIFGQQPCLGAKIPLDPLDQPARLGGRSRIKA